MGGLAEFTTKIYIDFLHLHYKTHRHTPGATADKDKTEALKERGDSHNHFKHQAQVYT